MKLVTRSGTGFGRTSHEEAASTDAYDSLRTLLLLMARTRSAKDLLGEPILLQMAQELARIIRTNASIDWNLRESVRARLRSLVRRLLRKYKYPPDAQEKATDTVLKQAAIMAEEWVA